MWLSTLLVGLLASQGVVGDLRANTHKMTEGDVLQYFRQNPYALPPHARTIFQEKTKNLPMNLVKRQSSTLVAVLGSLANTITSSQKSAPKSKVADVQDSPSPLFQGYKRKKIRYGPYRIPATSENNIEFQLLKAQGMANTLSIGVKKPCTSPAGNCMILDINASLEYDNGTEVPNNPSGAWLHHVVLINAGFNVKDGTCGGITEQVFESGNERSDSPYFSPPSGIKSAYHVRSDDIFIINTELMNMEDKEKWAWLTMSYDYIDGFDKEWKEGKIVWMSIGPNRCTGSELNPFGATNLTKTQQPIRDVLEEYSPLWQAPADGLILGANSHMHDGGTSTQVYMGEEMICDSIPVYSKDAQAGMSGGILGGHTKRQIPAHAHASNANIEHIASQPPCVFKKPVSIKRGESIYIKARYDFTKHEGMVNSKGERDEIMAIAGCLVAFDYPLR